MPSYSTPRLQPTPAAHASRAGTVSIAMGLLALLGSAWAIYLTVSSAGPEVSDLIRAVGMALLPIGLLVGIPTGILALRHGGAHRRTGHVGLGLAVAALASFVALLATVDH